MIVTKAKAMPASRWWLLYCLATASISTLAPGWPFFTAVWGLELSITYPANFSCVVPGSAVQVEVGLEVDEHMDNFISNLSTSSLCIDLDGEEGSGRASSHRLCSPGPSASLQLPPLHNGCHTMRAELLQRTAQASEPVNQNVTTAISAPIYFQVTHAVGAICTELSGCAPSQASPWQQHPPGGGEEEEEGGHPLQLVINSPRGGDRVYGTSALLSLSLNTRNGSQVTRKGQLCLQYKVYLEHSSEGGGGGGGGGDEVMEECLGVSEDSYDGESLEVPIQVRPPEDAIMDWGTSRRAREGITMDVTAAFHLDHGGARGSPPASPPPAPPHTITSQGVIFTLEPFKPRDIEEVVLSQVTFEADPSLLPSLPMALVVSHYEEDLSWLRYQPHPAIVYEKKTPRGLSGKHFVPVNVAGEATAYLKFIVDYYDQLPQRMIFLHGHRVSYHQEDILLSLRLLEDRLKSVEYCNINRVVWGCKEDPEREYLTRHWEEWLGSWLGPLPPILLDRCCAQFVVHRDRVRRLPYAFFKEALERLYHVDKATESRKAGLLLEWLWHYLFGQDAVGERALEPLVPLLPDVDRLNLAARAPCFPSNPQR